MKLGNELKPNEVSTELVPYLETAAKAKSVKGNSVESHMKIKRPSLRNK